MRLLRDLGRGAAAGADGPHRLVGDRDLQHLRGAERRRARRRAACAGGSRSRRRRARPRSRRCRAPARARARAPRRACARAPRRSRRRARGARSGRAARRSRRRRSASRTTISPVNAPLGRVVGVLAPDADAGVAEALGDDVERRERRADREVDLVELVDQRQQRGAERRPPPRASCTSSSCRPRAACAPSGLLRRDRGHARQDVALPVAPGRRRRRSRRDRCGRRGPACVTAATESPPPTTVWPGQAATASATARVPAANGASSNAPIGPFQNTVRAPRDALPRRPRRSAGRCRGPSSRAGSTRTAAPSTSVSAENSRPATTSTGSASSQSCAAQAARARRASACPSSSSCSESPIARPSAAANVKAIAPPIRIASARSASVSSTPILSATLTPPAITTNGRSGASSRPPSASSSRRSSSPAAAGSRCATPSVEACARCAAPKASLT